MVKLDLPLRPWVPQWLGVLTIVLIFLPISMLNGAYTGSMLELSNSLGVFSEDISMGYYATSVGMAVAYPIVRKVLDAVPPKSLLLGDLLLQALLSFFCSSTNNIDLIIVCSFFIGILKAFVMLWCIIHIQPLFTPNNVRSEFYSYFFPLVFGMGQISMAVTAQLAYYYDWKYMYYFMMLGILVAIVAILICFRYAKVKANLPLRDIDFRGMLIISTAMLMLLYVFTYGRVLDWFASSKIVIYLFLAPLLIILFTWQQLTAEKPHVFLRILHRPKSMLGYFYMFLTMFFSASSTLTTTYLNSVLGVDSVHTNTLSLFLIPGFAVGGFICFWWFRWQRWRFRFLIAGGMACYALYFGMLYFGISPSSTYEMLYLPMFLRGLGMMILVIAFGIFVVEEIDLELMLTNAFFVIGVRSALGPVIGVSFYNNMLYTLRQHALHRLSDGITLADPLAANRYNETLQSSLASGHSFDEAQQLATNTLYSLVQQQSLLLALKTLLGYLLIATIILAIISRFIPFHKTVKVDVVKTGDDMG